MTDALEEDEKQVAAELTARLIGMTRIADQVMSKDAVWTAFISAAVCYAMGHGIPEATIREGLRAVADNLAASEPPAPTVN